MFAWLYKRFARGFIENIDISKVIENVDKHKIFVDFINDEKNQEVIDAFCDDLYQRYMAKVMMTLTKSAQVVGGLRDESMPQIFNRKGELNLKGLIPMFLGSYLQGQGQSGQQTQEKTLKFIGH